MSLNFSASSRAAGLAAAVCLLLLVACGGVSSARRGVTVSTPAMGWFVSRLCPDSIEVNVMIPQGADHDNYNPRPSQMARLANSAVYVALGPLEFEATWRGRLCASAPHMEWAEASEGIEFIDGEEHDGHRHAADPHFWLSPRQAATMARNVAKILKTSMPDVACHVDSALPELLADIARADTLMLRAAQASPGQTFVVYHPSLAYVARDYGFRQLTVGNDGVSPQPRRFAALTDSARRAGARVFFIQPGFTPDRVDATAAAIGARVVSISPESADWLGTMGVIADALSQR